METAFRDARRALARLRRSLEKARRELETMRSALEAAEDAGLPGDEYEEARDRLRATLDWLHSEEARLRAKALEGAGFGGAPGKRRGNAPPAA